MSQGLSSIVYTVDSITAHQGGSWSVTIGSGTNGIGKLTANSGVDIGDVDVTSTTTATNRTTGNVDLDMTVLDDAEVLAVDGCGSATVQVSGAWSGTIAFEKNNNGTDWSAIKAIHPTTGAGITDTSSNGQWTIPCAGWDQIRCRVSSTGSGTATVHIQASSGCQAVSLANPLPTGSNTIGAVTVSGSVTVGSHAVTNIGTFATQDSQVIADNSTFTDGTSKLFMSGYIYDDVAGTALTENDAGAPRINVNRGCVSVIEDGSTRARYATVTVSNALKVDGSAVTQPVSGTFWQATQPVSLASVPSHAVTNAGTFAVQVDGSALTALQLIAGAIYAEDTASADLDKGMLHMAKRAATPAVTSGTDGDYEPLQTSKGRLWVEPSSPVVAAGQVTVTNTSAQLVAARPGRQSITIVNLGTTDVYLGAGTVTTSNGLLLVGIKGAAVTIQTSAAINCIVASGTQAVSYMEEYTA